MKVLITALAVVVAVLAQGQLGGALVLGTTPLDLGLIAVVCIALTSGPTVGLLAGMCAGLAQDALGGGIIASKGAIIGIGGLANTVVVHDPERREPRAGSGRRSAAAAPSEHAPAS